MERAHGDGIKVSTESPEAFEEVFWMTFDEDDKDTKEKFKILKTIDQTFGMLYRIYLCLYDASNKNKRLSSLLLVRQLIIYRRLDIVHNSR